MHNFAAWRKHQIIRCILYILLDLGSKQHHFIEAQGTSNGIVLANKEGYRGKKC